jgi:hypothetical protein
MFNLKIFCYHGNGGTSQNCVKSLTIFHCFFPS